MRKLTQIPMFIAVVALLAAAPVFSDTLVLKSGERISGCNAPQSCLLNGRGFFRLSVGECLDVREKLAAGM